MRRVSDLKALPECLRGRVLEFIAVPQGKMWRISGLAALPECLRRRVSELIAVPQGKTWRVFYRPTVGAYAMRPNMDIMIIRGTVSDC